MSCPDQLKAIAGRVVPGYGVASGRAANSPYPQGTILMQRPHFESRGMDFSGLFLGTLNISIAPYTAHIRTPQFTFEQVRWYPEAPPETFSFSKCVAEFEGQEFASWIYYPHPETKPMHFQDPTTLEILAPPIPGIAYGHQLHLWLNPQEVIISQL